jgi:DNA-directed RNA polymerase subunit beta
MIKESENYYRDRLDFSKITTVFPMPDLLAIQRGSYAEFLQMELLAEERKDTGLQAALRF